LRAFELRRLELTQLSPEALDLVCECAKGTYIRVLGEDIARRLGTLGHLTRLRRTWVEPFRDLPMIPLDTALASATSEGQNLLPPDAPLKALPSIGLTEAQAVAVRRGQAVDHVDAAAAQGRRVRLYDPNGRFMGLAEASADGQVQPRRLFTSPDS
jgi:tRNA pseudouridine55 synthase